MTHGGKRKGAGRPPTGHKRMELQLNPKAHAKIAAHKGHPNRNHYVETAVELMEGK